MNVLARTITFRPSTPADLGRILPLIRPDAASSLTAQRYRAYLDGGQYSHDRTWIAVDRGREDADDEVLAVAVWWADPKATGSGALDAVYVHESLSARGEERVTLAAGLLSAAHRAFADEYGQTEPPRFHVFVPADWRDRPDVGEVLTWRQAAVERAGLGTLLERLRFEWTLAHRLAAPTRNLEFRAEPDDEVFVDLFTRVLNGSLDTTSTREAAQVGAEQQARRDVAFLRDQMLGERRWWRVAVNRDGDTVGFAVPSRNPVCPVVGYLGVLPEHRGHGHVRDILVEITRILVVEAGATTIRADTDLVNEPMAAAFLHVGYRNRARRLVFSAS
jgi:RimJ/RimL family protein N-acetyltransferase